MAQPSLTLYHYPLRACSHVTFVALVKTGLAFDDVAVDIRKPDRTAEHLAVNPEGKVPTLVVDGTALVENVAILTYLERIAPEAQLFPATNDPFVRAQYLSDLVWVAATLHPAIRQMRMPMRFTDGDPTGVRAKGLEFTTAMLGRIEKRLRGRTWWYGDTWSMTDVYLTWAVTTAASTGLIDMDAYPATVELQQKVRSDPVFQQAVERQAASKQKYGIEFPDVWATI